MNKNYLNKLHNSTKRNYLDRMINKKVLCMIEAKKYEKNYWDGDRKFGYGGYIYIPNRWKPFAKKLIKNYKLKNGSKNIRNRMWERLFTKRTKRFKS